MSYTRGGQAFHKNSYLRKCRNSKELPLENQKAKKTKKVYNPTKSVNRARGLNSKVRSSFFPTKSHMWLTMLNAHFCDIQLYSQFKIYFTIVLSLKL